MNRYVSSATKPARILSLILTLILLLGTTACREKKESSVIADYGTYGSEFAESLAADYPYRSPYSQQEVAAADRIFKEFSDLGYEPMRQSFAGEAGSSQNIVVQIPGSGFRPKQENQESAGAAKTVICRRVLVGAHYDVAVSEEHKADYPSFDGISDNASGVAALLTLAKQLKKNPMGYDVVLVAFGAGNDDFAGAKYFAENMIEEDVSAFDAVYIIGPIYAGDKLYAHAGRNSLEEGKKYEMRRKLYQATDVVFEHQLRSRNGVDLMLNQSLYSISYPEGSAKEYPYREFTTRDSDYVPFDELDIPCVYIESGNYDMKEEGQVKESTHPAFEEVGGIISGSKFDSTTLLVDTLPWGTLQKRINNTAFILLEAIRKGADGMTAAN